MLGGLKALDSRARRKGLKALDPSRGALISIGMEIEHGRVVKNGYGVFNLAWQAEHHPEWAATIEREVSDIREQVSEFHDVPVKFVIWTGMGGSIEDKAMYQAAGLLRRGPRFIFSIRQIRRSLNRLSKTCGGAAGSTSGVMEANAGGRDGDGHDVGGAGD